LVEYRVRALYYRFVSDREHDRFDEASPLTARRGDFDCSLVDELLTAIPIVELKNREKAREALEPHLRDWEQDAFLSQRAFSFHFQYESSDIEALDPDPGNVYVFPEVAVGRATAFGAAAVIRRNSEYPPPYPTYRRTPVTDNLVVRLRRTRDGRERGRRLPTSSSPSSRRISAVGRAQLPVSSSAERCSTSWAGSATNATRRSAARPVGTPNPSPPPSERGSRPSSFALFAA
jgi:hypothetical protein